MKVWSYSASPMEQDAMFSNPLELSSKSFKIHLSDNDKKINK